MNCKLEKSSKQMCMSPSGNECQTMTLAHSYVPWQFYKEAFSPQEALRKGTLFPELYGVYLPPK